MGQYRVGLSVILGLVGFSVLGCSSEGGESVAQQRPIDAEEATATTNARVDDVLTGLADATTDLDTTDSTSVATDGLSAALGSSRCDNARSSDVTTTAADGVDSIPETTTNSLSELITRVRDEAKEHVFREDLVESQDGNQVIYKMSPAEVCDDNTDCIDKLTQNPLRFAVTANTDDTLNVAMLVGQDRHNPASATLANGKLAVRGNLAEVMDSLRLFMSTEEQKDLPEKLVGTVEWSIEKRATGDFVISSSILERFELLTGQANGKPVSVSVQPSSPTSQITINSVTNSIGFRENIGTIDVSVAGAAVCDDMNCGAPEQAGNFGLHLAGFTGAFETTAGATEVTFSDLGLGPNSSYLAVNGQNLTTVDVNPNDGRKFSMNFKKTAEGTLVTFEPALDLKVAMAMTRLSESMRVDMPDWLFDEVFDVTLGGAPKPSILIPAATCDADGNATTEEQLKVITGSLSLDATSLSNPVEVVAGMCLLPTESNASEPHPFTLLTSGTCQ